MKACADTLVEFPELNARFEGDAIVYLDRYDLGVAVQTDDGLVVVVVRDVGSKSIEELHEEIGQLAERARSGQLKPDEVRGSTFTVTSAGKLAGLFQTPIVNHPEVAILSIGRVAPRPVVRDGEVVVRRTGTIAVSFDHRVVDGARAAAFGLAVIGRLEGAAQARSTRAALTARRRSPRRFVRRRGRGERSRSRPPRRCMSPRSHPGRRGSRPLSGCSGATGRRTRSASRSTCQSWPSESHCP